VTPPTERTRPAVDWRQVDAWRTKRVHVVGVAGTEGAAIARFLAATGVERLTLHDLAGEDAIEAEFKRQHVGLAAPARAAAWIALRSIDARWHLADDYLADVADADVVFAPQAWYLYARNLPALGALRDRGVPFYGLMDLYFGLSKARIIAVTGSNGKSTTSRLIEHVLRQMPGRVFYAGNERRSVQVLDVLADMQPSDRLVLEVSNRHLIDLEPHPWIGVVTNVLPNHLDEHGGDLAAYARTKRKLVAGIDRRGWAVLNADNALTSAMGDGLEAPVFWYSRRGPVDLGVWSADGLIHVRRTSGGPAERVASLASFTLPGAHNVENALAASAAALLAGATPDAIDAALATFRGLRHRTQLVWSAGGVRYYDDLNATTPQATIAALEALTHGGDEASPDPPPVVLLIGGDDKGLDVQPLVAWIRRRVRRLIVLPGPGGERIASEVERAGEAGSGTAGDGPVIDRFDRLPDAVAAAAAGAVAGDIVLLSPACPYFFRRHYVDGGGEVGFRQLLRTVTAASPSFEHTTEEADGEAG